MSTDFRNLTRRELLRLSGLSIAGVTLLAACGTKSGGAHSANIASAGTVPPTTALGEAVVSDVVLLRTAASLEYNLIDFCTVVLDGGLLTGDFAVVTEALKRFRDDHNAHADSINQLVVALNGKAQRCANARVSSLYVDPALALITHEDNADGARDTTALAHALENLATQTYQGIVSQLSEPRLRASAMHNAQDEARHAVVLAQILNPGYAGVGPSSDPVSGKANIAAVPGAFGGLSSIQLTVGTPNADGVKTSLALETPSLNGLVYEFVTC